MIETLNKKSSLILSSQYDADAKELRIWLWNGPAYKYSGVPPTVWLGLQNASSLGQYWHRQIKGRFPSEQFD